MMMMILIFSFLSKCISNGDDKGNDDTRIMILI